LSGVHQG